MLQYFLIINMAKSTSHRMVIILIIILLSHLVFSFIFYAIYTMNISSILFNWIRVKKANDSVILLQSWNPMLNHVCFPKWKIMALPPPPKKELKSELFAAS